MPNCSAPVSNAGAAGSETHSEAKRTRRAPRQPIYGRSRKVARVVIPGDGEDKTLRPALYHPTSLDEATEILSHHADWANIRAKFAAKLRAAGVPENCVEDVSDAAVRRILECKRKGVDTETLKWAFAWDILEKYIFPDFSENKKKRFRLYAQRIGSMELTPRERQISFYVVWGLGNKEIADKIGTGKDNVNKHVQNIRRKLGIEPVAVDDRLATVLNLLGL